MAINTTVFTRATKDALEQKLGDRIEGYISDIEIGDI